MNENESARLLENEDCSEASFLQEKFHGTQKNRSSSFLVGILAVSVVLNLIQGLGMLIGGYTRASVNGAVNDIRSNFGTVGPPCETDKRLTYT